MSNHLSTQTSLYLIQHAENPVDWHPWGQEAFDLAHKTDKPILLSIGYSACHWCHVMAHESFENPEIARLMNEHFVNIKVDREERPDIDEAYMQAIVGLTGSGGWPLTVFLNADGKPFYGGTYFPPDDRPGLPGFARVLRIVSEGYQKRRREMDISADQITAALTAEGNQPKPGALPGVEILDKAYAVIRAAFDATNGGFGAAPKFPPASVLEFLLRYHYRTQNDEALTMVTHTLDKMAMGGIYDQLGGGFHRYSTDASWLVPHFEKMLYDNALLAGTYLHAFIATGKRLYRRVAEKTLDYVLREMTDPRGGFYSSQDADSDGVEGKYYLWTRGELASVISNDRLDAVADYFGVSTEGQIDGCSVLHLTREPDLTDNLERDKVLLLESRKKRAEPVKDTKIITAWNALMMASLVEAGCVLDRQDYLEAALANARFIVDHLCVDGQLKHSFAGGRTANDAFLQDYVNLANAFIVLGGSAFETTWLDEAIKLSGIINNSFWDESRTFLFDAGPKQQPLFMRPRSITDSPIPSGASATAWLYQKVALLTADARTRDMALNLIRAASLQIEQNPIATANWLNALDFYLSEPVLIAVVGDVHAAVTKELVHQAWSNKLPNKIVVTRDLAEPNSIHQIAFLNGKSALDGKPTAYVCRGHTCQPPVFDSFALRLLL